MLSKCKQDKSQDKSTFLLFLHFILFLSIFVCLCLGSFWSSIAQASDFGWHFSPFSKFSKFSKNKIDPNSEYTMRSNLPFVDDITSDQEINKLQLTAKQKHQALVWGLNENQEKRYILLMQNRSGHYYQKTQLTPVEVLGINSRNNEERAQYAAMDAQQEFEANAKLLAFNAVFSQAANSLKQKLNLPMMLPFDSSKYSPYNYQPMKLMSKDKLMFFVKITDDVRPITAYLIGVIAQQPSIQLNVYFIGDHISKNDIVEWAKRQNLPKEMVNKGQITLNFDHGQYENTKLENKKTPLLILISNGQSHVADIARF